MRQRVHSTGIRGIGRLARPLLLALLLFLGGASLMNTTWGASRGTLVLFSANWCASCRDVVPIVREIAGQNELDVAQIDVDSQDAPRQARHYGLSIPTDEPPQVYFLNRGRATLVYNGKSFRAGGSGAVRTTLLQNLQQVLPSP
jgi:thiol-disulfide isomerase/thioredoxin